MWGCCVHARRGASAAGCAWHQRQAGAQSPATATARACRHRAPAVNAVQQHVRALQGTGLACGSAQYDPAAHASVPDWRACNYWRITRARRDTHVCMHWSPGKRREREQMRLSKEPGCTQQPGSACHPHAHHLKHNSSARPCSRRDKLWGERQQITRRDAPIHHKHTHGTSVCCKHTTPRAQAQLPRGGVVSPPPAQGRNARHTGCEKSEHITCKRACNTRCTACFSQTSRWPWPLRAACCGCCKPGVASATRRRINQPMQAQRIIMRVRLSANCGWKGTR